jgi:diguanylate cyclase (GGDEF)-like protein
VNDTLGHLAGDDILCEVVDLIRAQLQGNSVMGRLGGDEFALLLSDASAAQARETAAALLAGLQQHVFPG